MNLGVTGGDGVLLFARRSVLGGGIDFDVL